MVSIGYHDHGATFMLTPWPASGGTVDLCALKTASWFDQIFIEVDRSEFPNHHTAMIERIGPEVNLANVAQIHVIRLENFHLGREINFQLFQNLVGEYASHT